MRLPLTMELTRGWKFVHGAAKRWNEIHHGACYDATKAGHEVGEMDVFLRENDWREVVLPHDWNTEQPASPKNVPSLGFKPRDEGWYYIEPELPEYPEDACVTLEFEGVMGESVVYVNGVLAARNESGYTPFAVDVSDYVLPGRNIIVVSVDNRRWEGWWYEGAGIYRPVRLRVQSAAHLARRATFARPCLENGSWRVDLSSRVANTTGDCLPFSLRARSLDANGREVATASADGLAAPHGETPSPWQTPASGRRRSRISTPPRSSWPPMGRSSIASARVLAAGRSAGQTRACS